MITAKQAERILAEHGCNATTGRDTLLATDWAGDWIEFRVVAGMVSEHHVMRWLGC